MSQHPCSVPGCGRLVSTEMLMCGRHWGQVPRPHRSEVWDAWRHYQAGIIGIEQLREVQQRATDAVVNGGAS